MKQGSKLVLWDNPEGWDGEGGKRGIQDSGTHVHPWLIHVDVWQKPVQYCKVISLQKNKINRYSQVWKKKEKESWLSRHTGHKSVCPWDRESFFYQLLREYNLSCHIVCNYFHIYFFLLDNKVLKDKNQFFIFLIFLVLALEVVVNKLLLEKWLNYYTVYDFSPFQKETNVFL